MKEETKRDQKCQKVICIAMEQEGPFSSTNLSNHERTREVEHNGMDERGHFEPIKKLNEIERHTSHSNFWGWAHLEGGSPPPLNPESPIENIYPSLEAVVTTWIMTSIHHHHHQLNSHYNDNRDLGMAGPFGVPAHGDKTHEEEPRGPIKSA